jgi:hypothetical protein
VLWAEVEVPTVAPGLRSVSEIFWVMGLAVLQVRVWRLVSITQGTGDVDANLRRWCQSLSHCSACISTTLYLRAGGCRNSGNLASRRAVASRVVKVNAVKVLRAGCLGYAPGMTGKVSAAQYGPWRRVGYLLRWRFLQEVVVLLWKAWVRPQNRAASLS